MVLKYSKTGSSNCRGILFFMNKWIIFAVLAAIVLVGGFFVLSSLSQRQSVGAAAFDTAEFLIEGQRIRLKNGVAETEAVPGSASKTVTRYFGNDLKVDLDGDGSEDVAFILTQDRGGSGTFFYAVAALSTENGYMGSDGYLLGDRIAPQPTTLSQNPRHVGVVVFNYAERVAGEPMTSQPSVGKSAYLKLNPETMQWGVVVPDFEGESR